MCSLFPLPDIQRVFAYHGAEHKVIHAYEAGEVLVVENVRKYSTLHPRCGTSFLLFVMLISIVVFSLCGDLSLAMRLLSRVLLLPVIAGISYEFLKFTGNIKSLVNKLVEYSRFMAAEINYTSA